VSGERHGEAYDHAENEHIENTGSGTLRASIFGVSDGLVSNLALVMGVAGGTQQSEAVILAGAAGLLAGAFSMGAGEYVSMQTQRETMERQLHLEREHILSFPEEEQRHLVRLLIDNGLSESSAREMAKRIHEDIDPAVDFHALLELGIVPRQMGSPATASGASFFSFMIGAAIPLGPWLVTPNPSVAMQSSLGLSALALLFVGGAVTRITHRSFAAGAIRQLFFGGAAAGVTYLIGRWIGSLL
jgi:VIT1/CCC1 family predicted Fe2+/Mn2+ transporter